MARLVAIWHGALLEVRLGDAERVAALADEMHALVEEFALAHGRTACRWFRGWADARMGATARRLIAGFERRTKTTLRLGMLAGASEVLGYATEALVLAGDLGRSATANSRTRCKWPTRSGERVYLPQLFVMQAAIARARGDRAAADAAIRRAIAEARAQEAPWLELMALIELCDRHSATAKDRRALAALIDQLPEARDTAAVARARALLDKTKSDVDHACSCSSRCGCRLRRRTAIAVPVTASNPAAHPAHRESIRRGRSWVKPRRLTAYIDESATFR